MTFNRKETILDNLMSRTKAEIDDLRKLLDADVKSILNRPQENSHNQKDPLSFSAMIRTLQ